MGRRRRISFVTTSISCSWSLLIKPFSSLPVGTVLSETLIRFPTNGSITHCQNRLSIKMAGTACIPNGIARARCRGGIVWSCTGETTGANVKLERFEAFSTLQEHFRQYSVNRECLMYLAKHYTPNSMTREVVNSPLGAQLMVIMTRHRKEVSWYGESIVNI